MLYTTILPLAMLFVFLFGFNSLAQKMSLKASRPLFIALCVIAVGYIGGTYFFNLAEVLGYQEVIAKFGFDFFAFLPLYAALGVSMGRRKLRHMETLNANLVRTEKLLEHDRNGTASDISRAESHLNYGNALLALGRNEDAIESFFRAMQLAETVHGETHPAMLRFYKPMLTAVQRANVQQHVDEIKEKIAAINSNVDSVIK